MNNHNIELITQQLITFPSVSTDHVAIRNALDFVIRILRPAIRTKILDHNGTKLLWATTTDFKSPDILLLCHIDVVKAQVADFTPRVTGKRIIGRGSFDMKGSLAAMIAVLNTIKSNKNIQLLITSDEEIGGQNGAKWFFQKHKIIPDIAIVPDGTSIQEIVTKQKGPMHLVIEVTGKPSHGSRPWEGDNPITKLISIINEISRVRTATSNKDWLPTFTPTNFEAISSINQIPKTARLTLDLRVTSNKQLLKVKRILQKHNAKIINTFGDGIIFDQKVNKSVKVWASIVERITHKRVVETTLTGASDARHLPKATRVIVTRGVGGNAHGDNEWVDIRSLNQLVAITKLFIKNI